MVRARNALAAALALLAAMAPQAGAETEAELRALQAAQFREMFAAPDDLDLMFRYAMTSIRLKDYEAAITTLDRILIFNPQLARARLELGAAYFRIGSYAVAGHYFQEVADDEEAEEDVRARARLFLDEIAARTRQSRVSGVVSLGALFSTNANSGPDSRDILFFGSTARLNGADVTAQTDVGASFGAQVEHVYDLGGVNADEWRSELAAYAQRYRDTRGGDAEVLVLRSGPRLSADGRRNGLKIRPYAELDYVRSAGDALYHTLGAGVQALTSAGDGLTLDADLRVGWRDFHDGGATDKDGLNIRAHAGATRHLDDANILRGRLLFEYEDADDPSERAVEFGAEAIFAHRYDSGFAFAGRRWLATAGVRGVVRLFDEPSLSVPDRTREDLDLRFSLGNTAWLENNLALVLRAEYFLRESNVRNFDFDGFTLSASVRYAF